MNARLTKRSTTYCLICLLCLAGAAKGGVPASARAGQDNTIHTIDGDSDAPLWRVDLHPLGYPFGDSKLQWNRSLETFDTVDFVSESVVVATFVTRQSVPGIQRRDDPNRVRPYLLHAIFLDAATGTVRKMMDWPSDDENAGVFPRYDGSFLFFSMEHIVLYSADWKELKELQLPELQVAHSALAGIAESPSGKILMLHINRQQSALCIQVSTDSLDTSRGACTIPRQFTVSDDEMAASDYKITNLGYGDSVYPLKAGEDAYLVEIPPFGTPGSRGPISRILISERGKIARVLCDSNQIGGCWVPQFASNEFVVVYGMGGLSLLDLRGESNGRNSVFEKNFDSNQPWIDPLGRPVRPSAGGQRFAVALNEAVGTESIIDDSVLTRAVPSRGLSSGDLPAVNADHVEIYDLPAGRWIYSVKNKRNQFKQIWGLGLSPSGSKLVIDSGGVIQVYALPPVTQAASASH